MQFDSNGWLDEAIEIDCLENTSSRNERAIKYVVQHGTAGGSSAENIGNFYRSTIGGSNPVSTHFIIGKDGHIVQCVPLSLAAWANGYIGAGHASFIDESFNPNEDTASIEYVKNQVDANGVPDNSDELTDAQKLAGFRLNKCICETYNVPKQAGDANGGIIRHADIDPVNRSRCPGTFPMDELLAYLANGGNTPMSNIPQGWTDDGTTLKSPDSIPVVRGFRDFILNPANNWDPNDYPEGPEYAANPVEQSNAPLGTGTAQDFRMSRLGYTAKTGVYKTWLGQEYAWYKKQAAALQAQITQLQALPAVSNVLAVNKLASQIVQKTQVQ